MQEVRSVKDLVRAAKGEAGTLSADEVKQAAEKGAILIDVREPSEWAKAHIRGAVHIPRGLLEFKIADAIESKEERLVTYCAAGSRAALAAATLKAMGYPGAISSEAGFDELANAGLPVAVVDD